MNIERRPARRSRCRQPLRKPVWRNRAESLPGRGDIVEFLARKWQRELGYLLIKELWNNEQSTATDQVRKVYNVEL